MELRPYQSTDVDRLRRSYNSKKRAPIYVLPTGGGKTHVFTYICQGVAARGYRALILEHRRELIRQASQKLQGMGILHSIVAPGHYVDSRHPIFVGSVQTVVRRLGTLGEFRLIIIDEAHHATAGTWRSILGYYPQAQVLGVTATPCRRDGQGLGLNAGGLFDEMIEGPSVGQLIAEGFLAPYTLYRPPMAAPIEPDVNIRGGDYVQEQIAEIMDRPKITGSAIEHYFSYSRGLRAIAFCASVAHATHVAADFRAAGVTSEHVDGEMSIFDRDAVLGRFQRGNTLVLTSCDLISEGFDCPAANTAILLRHTRSLGLYRQQIGRVLRPEAGKEAIILDHVGNSIRNGLPDDPIIWSLDGKPRNERAASEDSTIASTWQCLKCYAIWPSEKRVCAKCGTVRQVVNPRELEQVAGQLERVSQPWEEMGLTFDQFRKRVMDREDELIRKDRAYFEAVARHKKYKPGWIEIMVKTRHQKRMKSSMGKYASEEYEQPQLIPPR